MNTQRVHLLQQRLKEFNNLINQELIACQRLTTDITLVGISKKQTAERVAAAIQAGLKNIGENYVQEAQQKFRDLPLVKKHFTGHVQTNKAKRIVALFDCVQSIDRVEAVIALNAAARQANTCLSVLLQLNISATSRFGCSPPDAPYLADMIREQTNLRFDGVMAISPLTSDLETIKRAFALAKKISDQLGGGILSLGMSNDWRQAIYAGSTMLRIGTALFGE